jgi:alcohol dehydrogenase class IV
MRFEFATATQIVFGPGTVREAGKLARPWGRRALVVTGGSPARAKTLLGMLEGEGIVTATYPVAHEPSAKTVLDGLSVAHGCGAEMVIGFGGGSVIDAAKAIAGLFTNPGEPFDYLEVVGAGRPLARPALPWMAIPTTAGTGAEVTRNAVLAVPERRVKVSLRSPHLLARVALVDPELTHDLPPSATAATGMDALTQLLEAYVCNRANPLTDALCRAGVPRAAKALPAVWRNPRDAAAREALALAALWSGLALANSGLGAVHGLAGPMGGMFSAPHGAVCAALLAPVMAANIAALRARAPEHAALHRYGEIACWLTGKADATPEDGIRAVEALTLMLQIPKLSVFGLDAARSADLVAQSQQASSMKANPIVLTSAELAEVVARAA